jgi:DNA-directed RNA polymerase specialized sigma24 family protein
MGDSAELTPQGPFEARYVAFLETVTNLRPDLHRYCTRMTGSVMDGEDVVQEALFQAYRKLDTFDDARPLKPWLFQIAHNRASISCAAARCVNRPKPSRWSPTSSTRKSLRVLVSTGPSNT